MSAKLLLIGPSPARVAGDELYSCVAALCTHLESLAAEHRRLLAFGWIVDGQAGNLSLMGCEDGGEPLCCPSAREQARTLARMICRLPPSLHFALEEELQKGSAMPRHMRRRRSAG